MDEQSRVRDLVPRRLAVFLGLLLVGLAVIAGLEGLYMWMPRLAASATDGRVAAFDLDGEGSLAVWFSSMTLALAGLTAIVVFTIRRHRADDYPGRYRVWLWAAACWFLLSIDETSSLHEGFKEMMVLVTGTRVLGDGSIWWVTVYFFLLGAVGTRLLVDMRECWLSSAAFLATAACYVVAVVAQLQWILPESGARGVMVEEGAEMLGNLMLLMAMGLHARHVILDAKGLLPERRELGQGRRYHEEEEYEEEQFALRAGNRSVTVHPPHGVPRPARKATQTAPSRREPDFTEVVASLSEPKASKRAARKAKAKPKTSTVEMEEAEPAPVQRKLTKAEKKAMRKRLKKMASERERRNRGK